MSGIRWGAVLPQGWRLDLGRSDDPVEQSMRLFTTEVVPQLG